jgi:hypothetical protein
MRKTVFLIDGSKAVLKLALRTGGAVAFFGKPCQPDALVAAVNPLKP